MLALVLFMVTGCDDKEEPSGIAADDSGAEVDDIASVDTDTVTAPDDTDAPTGGDGTDTQPDTDSAGVDVNDCVDDRSSDCSVSLDDAHLTILGDLRDQFLGFSAHGVGDVDGDGLDDLMIGAHWDYSVANLGGAAYLVSGAVASSLEGTVTAEIASIKLIGDHYEGYAGTEVVRAGDLNGDGLDDLLISAIGNEPVEGRAYLVWGDPSLSGERLLSDADVTLYGEHPDDFASYSMSSGDVDGDGVPDLMIGAFGADVVEDDEGLTYLLRSSDGLELSGDVALADAGLIFVGEGTRHRAGRDVSYAGDVDGDGLDDLLIGALDYDGVDEPDDEVGAAYLILGASVWLQSGLVNLAAADRRWVGLRRDAQAGHTVVGAGDVNGDGLDDMLVAAPGGYLHTARDGEAYLILGETGMMLAGPRSLTEAYATFVSSDHESIGGNMDAAGDVDGDGLADFLLGPIGSEEVSATLIYGAGIASLAGVNYADNSGFRFESITGSQTYSARPFGAGDVDGDGLDDLVFGDFEQDAPGGNEEGAAYLFFAAGL